MSETKVRLPVIKRKCINFRSEPTHLNSHVLSGPHGYGGHSSPSRLRISNPKLPPPAPPRPEVNLDGVKKERGRILVGDDALALDAAIRAAPEQACDRAFIEKLKARGHFAALIETAGAAVTQS